MLHAAFTNANVAICSCSPFVDKLADRDDDEFFPFASGNGGYGRLGHTVQQDEHKPKGISVFDRAPVDKKSIVGPSGDPHALPSNRPALHPGKVMC